MYSIFNCAKKRLMLKSYLSGINTSVFQRDIMIIYFWKTSELIIWLDRKTCTCNTMTWCIRLVIHQNEWYSCEETEAFTSNISAIVAQWYDIKNFPNKVFCARTMDGRVCIGNNFLRKYMPKYVTQIINRNKITCGYETCIIAILLKSYLNKWMLSQLAKIDKLYINY